MRHSKKSKQCPRCSSKDVAFENSYDDRVDLYICIDCDYIFKVAAKNAERTSEDIYDTFDDDDYDENDHLFEDFADEEE